MNLQMSPATLQESVTVTAEAPLINVTQSNLASTVSAEQVENLPLNGRNWVDLTLLSAGSKQNFVAETPGASFQLNVDGQQVTQLIATSFGQPRFSKDTIAEFEVITNRFDARQGRSTGMQVNAITKSGTNVAAGSCRATSATTGSMLPTPIQDRVLPYSNQQFSTTYGGPIIQDRFHYFANFEYEREPLRPHLLEPVSELQHRPAGDADGEEGRRPARLSVLVAHPADGSRERAAVLRSARCPLGGGQPAPFVGAGGPEGKREHREPADPRDRRPALNELAVNWMRYHWKTEPIVNWPNHPLAGRTG